MITRGKILDSIKYVVDNSNYVVINRNNIDNIISLLKESKREPWLNSDYLDLENFSQEQILFNIM